VNCCGTVIIIVDRNTKLLELQDTGTEIGWHLGQDKWWYDNSGLALETICVPADIHNPAEEGNLFNENGNALKSAAV
jgi:hypothetical protein